MKKRTLLFKSPLIKVWALLAYFYSHDLKADYTASSSSLFGPTQNLHQDLFYSLDEPLENLNNDTLQAAPVAEPDFEVEGPIAASESQNAPADTDSSQLFYPNLFQNNLFNPQQNVPSQNLPDSLPLDQADLSQPTASGSTSTEEKSIQPLQLSRPPTPSPQVTTPTQTPTTSLPDQSTINTPNETTPVQPIPGSATSASPNLTPTPFNTTIGTPPSPVTPPAPGVTTPQQALEQSPILQPQPTALQPQSTVTNPSSLLNPPPSATVAEPTANSSSTTEPKPILINFNNVAITEYIRFISRLTNKNFVFDENDLQFTVTIVSEEPTTIDNIMTALLQELRIHDLEIIEQDNTLIIHRNNKVASISKVVPEDKSVNDVKHVDLVTKVFRLNTLEADRAAVILKPMVSATALVEVLKDTNHLIITDLASNVREISILLKSLDSPQSGLVIGQYVVVNQPMDALISIAQKIINPLAQDQKISFIPHRAANSIFIVSNPYLVERTIAILKYLDQTAATTQILNPKDLGFPEHAEGQWVLDKNGNWQFVPGPSMHGGASPKGNWRLDDQGNWYFEPGEPTGGAGPDGKWVLDKDGNWVFQLNPGKSISPKKVQRKEKISSELPLGHIERTQFSIYKLQFRKGEQIARALSRIAESLYLSNAATNADLLAAINSVQWIESSNSLIFTGTSDAIVKMRELIIDIDVPLRQVLLEMLILETDIADSLSFSTNVASRFGGGNTAGAEAFLSGASTLPAGIATSGIGVIPDAGGQIGNVTGFVLGIIGQTITHNGTEFATLGALVKALHTRTLTRIVMNPKVLTEDNSPAEIFVGLNTQFPTQSIANNLGTILTQNFEFRDVGTSLKVTPMIGNNDVITLEIQEEVSSIVSGGVTASTTLTNQVIGPTTKINRTTTKVHVPNGFFLILSGMLSDQVDRIRTQVPCLGSIPVIGAAFSDKQVKDTRQNLMIFIHPVIIDTEEEIDNITRHEQNIYRYKNRIEKDWVEETDEAMDYFNIIDTENPDGDEDCY